MPAPHPRPRRSAARLLARLLPATAVVVAIVATGCSDEGAGGVAGDDGGTTTTVVRTPATDAPLDEGDCAAVDDFAVGGPVDPATFELVPCDQPHDLEVAAVFDHPAAPTTRFPGAAAVDGYATQRCIERFEAYVGAPYEASNLDVAFVAPGEEGWEEGDRRVACVLYHGDFTPLVGSVRGTGL